MRANRKLRDHVDAQVGIGTMIVFIATVLVAAIAAGVLIDTSGKLQERSSRTGDQATKQVASNLVVERIVGIRDATGATDKIANLTVYLGLAAGASKVDLKQVEVQISDGSTLKHVDFASDNTADADGFSITEVRDADSSIGAPATEAAVMTSGDLVYITLNLDVQTGLNLELDVRKNVHMTLVPEVGAESPADFTTPESYGQDTYITLA